MRSAQLLRVAFLAAPFALPRSAAATVAVSPAVPAPGAGTDLMTLSGSYLTTIPGSPLFSSQNFTLTLQIPAEFVITTNYIGLIPFDNQQFPGTYTVNGHEIGPFQAFFEFDGAYSPNDEGAHVAVSSLLTANDSFVVDFSANAPLFTVRGSSTNPAGILAAVDTGTFDVTFGAASYSVDPDFTGSLTLTGQPSVPEPASAGLLAAGTLMLAALKRRTWRLAFTRRICSQ
ncbi:PEP-CTERM sorting domain-containing protein [Acidibrevibacterium fodinaquatile]|uniref:PEP-CTERM sorting domain-containing protein n=1 Tax=Acidibrevibacterium fodinaquatile TaxID=1969806 RepID=UPI0013B3FBB7|nr:PEP-CTERM sorting domain-containing protein [Acidibrevibacterium fodinaquatile]